MRVLVLCLVVGCIPAPVYRVQRTARVPHPAAPLRTGEPLAGPAELSVGASSFGDVRTPRLVDQEAAVEVPDKQFRSELRFRIRRAEISAIYEFATEPGMKALDPTQAAVKEGSPAGYGIATRYSFRIDRGLSLGLGLEVMDWSIPYVEYRTCVEYCEENNVYGTQINYGRENVATMAFSFTPTYRSGPVAAFAGVYGRRHPTIVRKGTELFEMNNEQDVDAGEYNWLVHAGLEVRMPGVSAMLTVQQDLTRDPVWYGPSFGFAIAARLPEFARAPARKPREVTPSDGDLPDDPW